MAFPASLDTFPNPIATTAEDAGGFEHDIGHSSIGDAVEQLEIKVGINGSAVVSTHDYLISHHAHTGADGSVTTSYTNITGTHPLAAHATGSARIGVGTDGGKGAAATADRVWFATDTGILYRDTGAAWVEALRGETFSRLNSLSEKSHTSLTGLTQAGYDHHLGPHADAVNHTGPNKHQYKFAGSVVGSEPEVDILQSAILAQSGTVGSGKVTVELPPTIVNINGMNTVSYLPAGSVGNRSATPDDFNVAARWYVYLGYFTYARLTLGVNTAFTTTGKITMQYSTDGGGTWAYLESAGTGLDMDLSTTGLKDTGFIAINGAAKVTGGLDAGGKPKGVLLRVVAHNTPVSPGTAAFRAFTLELI